MVLLEDMPEEIIIMILKELDLYSKQSMFNTCSRIRNIVCMQDVIKECNISMSVMATAKTLYTNFFYSLSNHLQVLNMRGVPDLHTMKIIPVFMKMECLHTLDISFTNLNMLDLIDVYSVCPTLKNVTVNCLSGEHGQVKITQKTLLQCQYVFQHFESVHLVGSLNNLLIFKLSLHILERSKLCDLTFTVAEADNMAKRAPENTECQMPYFSHFAMYILNWSNTIKYEHFRKFPVLALIDFKKYEFFMLCGLKFYDFTIYATSVFKNFFYDNFKRPVECVTEYTGNLLGNVVLMMWNKETTKFDDNFFCKLKRNIVQYFPAHIVQRRCECLYVKPEISNELSAVDEESMIHIKKKRYALQDVVLDFDELFIEKKTVELSLMFTGSEIAGITLSPNLDYLWKLTYFSISGIVSYSYEFFSVLFRYCINLITLNVVAPNISPCVSDICRSIQLTKSLKNIRLVDRRIDFNNIFSSFSQCKSLENVHIIDQGQWEHSQVANPSVLLEKCSNLYCIVIKASLAVTARIRMLQLFDEAKLYYERHYLKVIINQFCSNRIFPYSFDPFMEVFQLKPLTPIWFDSVPRSSVLTVTWLSLNA